MAKKTSTLDPTATPSFKFDVFISYRHADLDSAVAGYLQKALEHYKIPREIRKKCGKQNISRVFRDEEELGVASDLFNEIEQNLKQSEFLLVICSPRIVQSKWCLREIETFIKYRGRENILAVLIEGEPDTAFPAPLLEEGEPLAADLRGKDKRQVLKHAKERMPRLAAPLIYCTYDELYQRHRVYKMRRMMTLAGLVAAVSLTFGAVTVEQNLEIRKNYQAKLENQSRHLAQTSATLLAQGDREAALLVALEALPQSSTDTSRPYVAEARIALEEALYTYNYDFPFNLRPQKVLEHKSSLGNCSDYNAEENVLLTSDSRIYIWDADTGTNICCWENDTHTYQDAKLIGKQRVAVLTDSGIFCFNYITREILWEWEYPPCKCYHTFYWDYSAKADIIVCTMKTLTYHYVNDHSNDRALNDSHRFHILDTNTGKSQAWIPAALYQPIEEAHAGSLYLDDFVLSPDGQQLLVTWHEKQEDDTYTTYLRVFRLWEEEPCFSHDYADRDRLENITWLDDSELAIIETLEGTDLLGYFGKERKWRLTCWQLADGQPRFIHEDTCMSLNNKVSVEAIPTSEKDPESIPLLLVVYDNVAVNLDRYTGQRYSRIEDRSPIMLSHTWGSGAPQLFITADGYVFITYPMEDEVFHALVGSYHYYLDVGNILKAEWHNGKAYLYVGRNVYCYSAMTDSSYTLLEETVSDGSFSADSALLLLTNSKNIYLYDTVSFDLLWQDACRKDMNVTNAALIDDCFVVYIDRDETLVKIHNIQDGTDTQVPLENVYNPFSSWKGWDVCQIDSNHVLVCNSNTKSLRDSPASANTSDGTQESDASSSAIWMIDLTEGIVTAQWSHEDLLNQSLYTDMTDGYISAHHPIATADGGYFIAPCNIKGTSPSQGDIDTAYLTVWDLAAGQPLTLSADLWHGMVYNSYFTQSGWVSPQENIAVIYDTECKVLRVIDFIQNQILHELPVDGIGSIGVSFTPDGDHLIFQDSALHLQIYNWKEGRYTMFNALPEKGIMSFRFSQNGKVLSSTMTVNAFITKTTLLYQRAEDGIYKLDTSIDSCIASDGRVVVINSEAFPRLYHVYSLDELIAKAKEILNGRELTEAERQSYLID